MGTTLSSSSPSTPTTTEVLDQACQRKCPAEIEIEINDEDRQFGRMRLLAHDSEALYVDRPTYDGLPLELASGLIVHVYFMHRGERDALRSRLIEECQVSLSSPARAVPGFKLERIEQVIRQERRTDYRVSMARFSEVTAELRVLGCDDDSPCLLARLMNISAGGFAAIVIDLHSHGHDIHRGTAFQIDFDLPKINRHFCFKAELRHIRTLDATGSIMGMKYLPESNAAEMRHAIRQISQFVAKELKRKDGPGAGEGDDKTS